MIETFFYIYSDLIPNIIFKLVIIKDNKLIYIIKRSIYNLLMLHIFFYFFSLFTKYYVRDLRFFKICLLKKHY